MSLSPLRHGPGFPPLCNPGWTLASRQGRPLPTPLPPFVGLLVFSEVAAHLQPRRALRLSAARTVLCAAGECKCSAHAFLKELGNLCIQRQKFISGFRKCWGIHLVSRVLRLLGASPSPPGPRRAPLHLLACSFWLAEMLAGHRETFTFIPNRSSCFLMTERCRFDTEPGPLPLLNTRQAADGELFLPSPAGRALRFHLAVPTFLRV